MKTIDKIVISEFEPSNNLVGWYNPAEKTLKFFENGEWQAQKAEEYTIATNQEIDALFDEGGGGGSGSGSSN